MELCECVCIKGTKQFEVHFSQIKDSQKPPVGTPIFFSFVFKIKRFSERAEDVNAV